MIEWLQTLDPLSLQTGLLAGLLAAMLTAWLAWRQGQKAAETRLRPEISQARELLEIQQDELKTAADRQLQQAGDLSALQATREALNNQLQGLKSDFEKSQQQLQEYRDRLADEEQARARLDTRLQDKEQYFHDQLQKLENAEQRLTESFERLAGKIFEDRSQKLSDLNTKQLDGMLKPLGEKLQDFRTTVTESHKQEIAQHKVLQEKLKDLEKLNERLHGDAENLTKALTSGVKAQGNWGEQQLERLLELAGLVRGREYSTQVSITTESGSRIQPDLVLHLPEGKSIIMDSKVSLTDWTRFQAEQDEARADKHLKAHIQSIKTHIRELAEKRYAEVPELNALDFVLMFVPIESALIEALRREPGLPAYALENKVALLSPTNFLATLRTVASVWSVHKQNSNARIIADRAGKLYDKFVGFVDSLKTVGERLQQAQSSYDKTFGQLSQGAGNLIRQTEMLKELGARSSKQLDQNLTETAREDDKDNPALRVIHTDDDRQDKGS